MSETYTVGELELFSQDGKVYVNKSINYTPNLDHGLNRKEVKELISILGKMLDDQVLELFPDLNNLS